MSDGDVKQRRKELVAQMRGFDSSNLNLDLQRDEKVAPLREQDARLYASRQLRYSTVGAQWVGIGLIVIAAYMARSSKYVYITVLDAPSTAAFFVGLLLVGAYFLLRQRVNRYTNLRLQALAETNNLIRIDEDTELPGDITRDGKGTKIAYGLTPPFGEDVQIAFGSLTGWWDPNTKPPRVTGRYNRHKLLPQKFVYIAVPGFTQDQVLCSPNLPTDRDALPAMTAAAFEALSDLLSRYAVALGSGAIIVTPAGGKLNPSGESLDGDFTSIDDWHTVSNIISGKLATVVEGLI